MLWSLAHAHLRSHNHIRRTLVRSQIVQVQQVEAEHSLHSPRAPLQREREPGACPLALLAGKMEGRAHQP